VMPMRFVNEEAVTFHRRCRSNESVHMPLHSTVTEDQSSEAEADEDETGDGSDDKSV